VRGAFRKRSDVGEGLKSSKRVNFAVVNGPG
jgi:hypothetical protein